MAFPISSIDLTNGCVNDNGYRKQQQVRIQFLCAVAQALDGALTCDFDTDLATAAEAGFRCTGGLSLAQVQKNTICDALNLDCTALDCFSPEQLDELELLQVQKILNEIVV